MIETIRPTMSMVRDLMPGMQESWILNDCAIGETKRGEFVGLVVCRIDEGEIFYGFIPNLMIRYSRRYVRETLDNSSETFSTCPRGIFNCDISWSNVKEGHRYA